MSRCLKMVLVAAIATLVVACGGGSSGDGGTISSSSGAASTPRLLPTVWTSEGRSFNSCLLNPVCSNNPYAPFFAQTWEAPPNGATVKGVVRIEVRGNLMKNVELLPGSGYTPRLGVFNITGDGALAWLDFDTTRLPNGPLKVRVSAFDVAAGQPGAREIVTMSERTWNINNATQPVSVLTAAVASAPMENATVSGIVHLEIRGSGIVNAELLPASGYTPRLGVFNVSADRTRAWLDFDTRSLPDGVQNVRVSAFNTTQGQPGATEIIAMPPRQWTVANGKAGTAPFTAALTVAPPYGELLSGYVRLELRGNGLKNVELQSPSGQTLGVFSISGYQAGSGNDSFAYLDFDTSQLPNGLLDARIVAYDAPAGQANAREIVMMSPRQWDVLH